MNREQTFKDFGEHLGALFARVQGIEGWNVETAKKLRKIEESITELKRELEHSKPGGASKVARRAGWTPECQNCQWWLRTIDDGIIHKDGQCRLDPLPKRFHQDHWCSRFEPRTVYEPKYGDDD